jgi:hypothetical protein
MLEYHRNHYRKNRKRILAKRVARSAAKVQSAVNNGDGTTSLRALFEQFQAETSR